jgi:glycosyltransferase involved in cell wall biosynthesis
MQTRRLLYLGNAFPPGISGLFPESQPAGHLIETNLISSLSSHCEIRSVGISNVNVDEISGRATPSPGLPNRLNLLDRPPQLWTRWRSLRCLRHTYRRWLADGWSPELIVVCNFSPVYNAFIRGIAGATGRPYLVLYMADSTLLDVPLSRTKRLRYRFKPFKWLDNEMAGLYDACVAVSAETEARFRKRGIPWLWLPNGVDPARIRTHTGDSEAAPITFGYFGHASDHTGIHHLLKVFTATSRTARLKVCCFGKARNQLAQQFARATNVSFHGPFDPDGCVAFGATCDVLVNPRPRMPENRNNFPSKIFEYALTGRAILSNQLSGADRILGPHAYYFDADDYTASLSRMLDLLAETPRAELRRRGAELQSHLLKEYSWETQGRRLAAFLEGCLRQPQNPLHDGTPDFRVVEEIASARRS